MKNLWLGSCCICLFLGFFSCSGTKYKHWKGTEAVGNEFNSYFDNSHPSARYKAEISIYGKHFSGILFFKFTNDTTCHTAFISVPGLKLFDMELTSRTDTVYDCISQLNRPGVLNTIKKNIRIFTMLDNFEGEPQRIANDNFNGVIWKRSAADRMYFYYQPTNEGINKIELLNTKYKRQIVLTAQDFKGNFPSTVHIKGKFTLTIHLTQL